MTDEPGIDLSFPDPLELGVAEQQVMGWLQTHPWHVHTVVQTPPIQTGPGEILITISVLS
jgi:hypothetical protein